VLAFALSQGVVRAGIVAVLLMAIGTALTVAVLASLAVGLKGFALNAGGGGAVAANLVWWAELLGAVLVFGFGAMLLVASF
jgi:nickel/cobalt transporter (NicO) family protein